MVDILTQLTVVLGSLGGLELIKFIVNKKNNAKIVAAKADQEETKADTEEFHLIKEQFLFLQEQLKDKEVRFAEQTQVVRGLNTEVVEMERKIGQLQLELAMKRCEIKKCPKREPQNGY